MQKLAWVTPPPSPLVPQKGPFNGREGQRDWSSAEKKFFTASIFSLYATNGIGIFFTLVNVFCHMLFFDFIGLGSYKNAACGLETRVKIFCYTQAIVRGCLQWKINCNQWKINCNQWKINCNQWKINCNQWKIKKWQWPKQKLSANLSQSWRRGTSCTGSSPCQPSRIPGSISIALSRQH